MNRHNEKKVGVLTYIGIATAVAGIVLLIVGFVNFMDLWGLVAAGFIMFFPSIGLISLGVRRYFSEKEISETVKAYKKAIDESEGDVTCKHCGAANSRDDNYCKRCGKPLLLLCSECGARISEDDKFCSRCGKAVK